jgi:uncharacterized protein (TIGR04168 family)
VSATALSLAVIGDVHLHWDEQDVNYFNQSNYDLLLFVGDIASYNHRRSLQVYEQIGKLSGRALVMLGNHDGVRASQLVAEVVQATPRLLGLLSRGQEKKIQQIRDALGNVLLVGYSLHHYRIRGYSFAVIVGRPLTLGGEDIGYVSYLRRAYGVDSMESSGRKLRSLVDQTTAEHLIFLGHNGPAGLGEKREDIWGCDFKKSEGDYGDPDLKQAVDYAVSRGKKVWSVIAGHMHHRMRGGDKRAWLVQKSGITYVNAARVPRIFEDERGKKHHHISIHIDPAHVVQVQEVLVPVE